ncbi:OCIA domain-containing protein 1 [Pelodytes ibericus]
MASSQAGLSEQPPQQGSVKAPGVGYVPTEEERKVFRQCNEESFWYRSLPFSVVGMIFTRGLIARGILSVSPRFGSIPKVAFAGVCGYLAGKVSYMKICQEKFKSLDNSPLGDALRKGYRPSAAYSASRGSEFSDADVAGSAPLTSIAPAAPKPPPSVHSRDYDTSPAIVPFSSSFSESSTTGITDNIAREPAPFVEEIPKHRPMTYDELRNRNRETYEVGATQRADTSPRPSPERAKSKEVKTNKYGDVWEE